MDALAAILGVLVPSVSFEGLTVAQWIAIASAIEAAARFVREAEEPSFFDAPRLAVAG